MGDVVYMDDARRERQAARAACFFCGLARLALLGLVILAAVALARKAA